jgi:hypothetical protein
VTFPQRSCQQCGKPLKPKMQRGRHGPHFEAKSKFLNRKYCSPECRNRGVNRGKRKRSSQADYVQRALTLWRASFHPLQFPHQGSEAAQEHYRVCLGIYRGEA